MPLAPRPILKPLPSPTIISTSPLPFASSSHVYPLDSPHVHFPPTPTMTQTEITHSAFMYDRKPIVVVPNVCALPERGEREVDLVSPVGSDNGDTQNWAGRCKEELKLKGYFHPGVYEAVEYQGQEQPPTASLLFESENTTHSPSSKSYPSTRLVPPPLVFDSSESSDSSDLGSPILSASGLTPSYHFGQHVPNVDLNFLSPLETPPLLKRRVTASDRIPIVDDSERHSPKDGKAKPRTRNSSTSRLERTQKAAANVACSGFSTGFCDPPLDGCLGGF